MDIGSGGSTTVLPDPKLSHYGELRLKDGVKVTRHEEVMNNAFSKDNPDGIINLAVAENTLMTEYLATYFNEHFTLRHQDFTYGDSLAGNSRLRTALASFFNSHFHPHTPVAPGELIAGAGLLPMISQLGRALVDPGNAVLLLRPYYHGFDIALGAMDGVKVEGVAVPLEDMFTVREVEYFEMTLQAAKARDDGTAQIQAVFLVNPQNPYGRCYPREVLESYCRFCEQHDLHLVSDEIYGLSTFASGDIPEPEAFHSILSVDLDAIDVKPSRVHMLYGMSKDFDANGFRAGVLHTRHPALYQSLLATSIFSIVSAPSAELWAGLLNDEEGLAAYVGANQRALGEAYEHLTAWLKFHGVPYVPSAAGQGKAAREAALVGHLAAPPCRVVVNPGAGLHMPEAGWVRVTFTLERWVVDEALGRVERALGWERWPGLGAGGGEGKVDVKRGEKEAKSEKKQVKAETHGGCELPIEIN